MNDNEPQQQLWLSGDVAAALGCACHGPSDVSITGVSIDSRTVGEGDLFFAIKGDRFDGHDFVDGAIEQGASLAVVAHDKLDGLKADASKLLVVDDVLSAMEQLGRAARARLKGRVVAVTGSVGKTGTKEMMRLAFGACGGVHASVASFNNHWGVPLTLSRTPTDADFGIYEIGMNHPGEIVPLVDMVRPDVAIITTVAPVHLEFFDSEVEIARAKAEIFTGIQAGGKAVLNRDNKHFNFLQSLAIEASVDVVTFGETEGCDVALLDVDLQADGSLV
ncbi:MAG: Mur ligase family protein, partial [Hyphomicrobiales bacterium]